MKPKVAIILPYFGSGGAENMVSRLAAHVDLDMVDAEVICIYGQQQMNFLEKAVEDHGVSIKYIGKGKGFSPRAIIKLWKELSKFKPSVIHTHLSACVYCAPWVLFHRVKMLHTIHNTPKFELIRPKRMLMALMYKMKKAVPIAISDQIKRMMIDYYRLKVEPEVVYNPVDVARFDLPHQSHTGIRIVTVGRLSEQKNQKMLIQAVEIIVKKHPEVSLTILGDGPLKNDLEALIQAKSLEKVVILEGNVSNVEEYFSRSDIFALSSAYEGLPLVILEAMAASLPIVSTNVGGVQDIVTDNGILVPCDAFDEFVRALSSLVEDKNARNELGKLSRIYVQDYDSSNIARQYVKLYEKYTPKRIEQV